MLNKLKPSNYTESCIVNVADGWRERNVWYPGRSVRNASKGARTCGGEEIFGDDGRESIVLRINFYLFQMTDTI